MAKVVLRGLVPPDSPIYDQPIQLGGIKGGLKIPQAKSSLQEDRSLQKAAMAPKRIGKSKK